MACFARHTAANGVTPAGEARRCGRHQPLRTESGLGFSDRICNGDKGMGSEIFSSPRRLQSKLDNRTAFDMSVSPQVLDIRGSSSWHDRDLLETASTNEASSMRCRQSTWGRGAQQGQGRRGRAKGPKCLVWFGRPAGKEATPLARPDRAQGLYVFAGVQSKAETKAPSHAGRARYVHVR